MSNIPYQIEYTAKNLVSCELCCYTVEESSTKPFFNGTHLRNNTEIKEAYLRIGSPEIYIADMLAVLPCPMSISIDTIYQSPKSKVVDNNSDLCSNKNTVSNVEEKKINPVAPSDKLSNDIKSITKIKIAIIIRTTMSLQIGDFCNNSFDCENVHVYCVSNANIKSCTQWDGSFTCDDVTRPTTCEVINSMGISSNEVSNADNNAQNSDTNFILNDDLLSEDRSTIWYTRTSPVFEGSMQDKYIQATNAWRAIKGLNPLVYDPDLESTSRENNRISSELNDMGHHVTGGPGTGQNTGDFSDTPENDVDMWVSDIYNVHSGVGHRTNLMNPDYIRIGCDENGSYGTCTYGM
ncbi:hypothetical protein HDU92_007767 [Lobulomyces angularis]|nr:hypothetical protein HDU92_007767 [Lobulomyces angularis]